MYTLKSLDVRSNPTATIPGERLLMWVDAVFTNGTTDVPVDFKAENKDVMDNTLRSVAERLNRRDEELASINTEGYSIPPAPEPPAPTPEQIRAQLIAQKEAELNAEVLRVEQEKRRIEIAMVDPVVAEKLAELEAEKAKE